MLNPTIARIARKELLETMRDGRFRTGAATILLLLCAALLSGYKNYRDVSREHAQAQRETRRQWVDQGTKNPHSAAHYGVYAFKPKLPVSLFDRGTEAYTGVAVWLEAHRQNEFRYRPAQDANSFQRFGELTAASVLQILLPLLIIAMTFAEFSGERESGTLRQLLSLGVKRRELVLGKAAGTTTALALLLLPASLIGAFALVLSSEFAVGLATVPRGLMLAAVYLLYCFTLVGLSLAVSARAKSSRLSLVALLGFWIVTCLLAPRVATGAARWAHPTPSVVDFNSAVERDIRQGFDGHDPQDRRTERWTAQILKKHNVERAEQLPFNLAGLLLEEGERYGNRVFDLHFGKLWSTFEAQNHVTGMLSIASPMLAARSLSMGAAGTDFAHHRRFAENAESYRRLMISMLNEDIMQRSRTGDVYLGGTALWASVPPFEYTSPGWVWALANHQAALLSLIAWAAAAWVLALRSASALAPV